MKCDILRNYDYIPRGENEGYPFVFLTVSHNHKIVEHRYFEDSENITVSIKSTDGDKSKNKIKSYNINTPWAKFDETSTKKNMSRMIPIFVNKYSLESLFKYRYDVDELKLKNIVLRFNNYENLKFEIVEDEDTAYKCENNKCIGTYSIVNNTYENEKYLVIVDYIDGYVSVISVPNFRNVITYAYKSTASDNVLVKDIPVEVNDKSFTVGIESPCIESNDEMVISDDDICHTVIYHPTVRYIEDWDLPSDIVYEDLHFKTGTKEMIRLIYSVDDEAWEFVKQHKTFPIDKIL